MSDVKKIGGYNIKDETARTAIDSSAIAFELVSGTIASVASNASESVTVNAPSKSGYKCIATLPASWSNCIVSPLTQGYTTNGITNVKISLYNPFGYAVTNQAYTVLFIYIKLPHT